MRINLSITIDTPEEVGFNPGYSIYSETEKCKVEYLSQAVQDQLPEGCIATITHIGEREHIGSVGVDSGSLMIVDPIHADSVEPEFADVTSNDSDTLPYPGNDSEWGDGAVLFGTVHGDAVFPVYIEREYGETARVIVDVAEGWYGAPGPDAEPEDALVVNEHGRVGVNPRLVMPEPPAIGATPPVRAATVVEPNVKEDECQNH